MNDKQQLAAMGAHMAEPPMCMAKRIEELEAQVRVMTGLLRDLRPDIELHLHNSTVMKSDKGIDRCNNRLKRIDDALAGKLPGLAVPEGWQLVQVEPTESMIGHGCGASVMVASEVARAYGAMLSAAPKPEAK